MHYLSGNLAYDGSRFHGLAPVAKNRSVSSAFSQVLGCFGLEKLIFAGRTDKGVHALSMPFRAQSEHEFKDLAKLKELINAKLPEDLLLRDLRASHEGFNPRFDARYRVYRYLLSAKEQSLPNAYYIARCKVFDMKKANELLSHFVGLHDFRAFSLKSEVKNSERHMNKAYCYAYKELFVLHFEASGFLRGQIRLIISLLLKVLEGKLEESAILKQLHDKAWYSRTLAPASGLYLVRVKY